jgi:hypothetical protein
MMIMEELSWLLLERTLQSLLEIRGRLRDTVSKLDMLGRCSNCTSASGSSCLPKLIPRTDKAVLATNGFAADGNNFVKRVRQRLEVCATDL